MAWFAVRFQAVAAVMRAAMDLETQLIKHYRAKHDGAAAWNGSGFGSNDPGRQRETTNRQPEGFDDQHPIDIDLPGDYLAPGTVSVATALATLKAVLPYTLRYETLRNERGRAQRGQPHADLLATNVSIPPMRQTVRGLMQNIMGALGTDWQATTFASHVILYKENRPYDYGTVP
ncbi:MAG: hypothetical protein EOO27_03280 [Comamonadaceae bacterium]|nr:MAG: hypothetical protein EOO27_03280 [Comamonadaceae bacterium]